jgi:DNA-binding MarR family transcriptional regulator
VPQADLLYAPNDAAGLPLAVSVYADRAHVREEIRDDAAAAGLAVRACGALVDLLEGDARPLGELVLVDCPDVDGAVLAALMRLDMRAAHSGAHLVIATSVAALDDVFACCDRSGAQILVDPSRAERVIALGRVLARLRPLPGITGDGSFRFESPGPGYRGPGGDSDPPLRGTRPPLPDPRLVRRIIRQRHLRARFFDRDLFADPAWDILLDLTAARAEHIRVSVTSLCIASGVPPTTALRWITQMTHAGLLQRVEDEADRRRAFIALSDRAADAMARYFADLGREAAQLV